MPVWTRASLLGCAEYRQPRFGRNQGGAGLGRNAGRLEAKLAGDTGDAESRFAAAQQLAEMRGFRYAPMDKVADLPLDQLLRRIEAVREDHRTKTPDLREAAALLGAVDEPGISISKALEMYWDLAREKTLGKSQDQLRRWRNQRIKAVKNSSMWSATSCWPRSPRTTCWISGTGGWIVSNPARSERIPRTRI